MGVIFAWFYFQSTIGSAVIIITLLATGITLANMSYECTHYAITNKRVVIQSGIIGRDFRSVDYDQMKNVSVDVGILGVLFKVGTIKIYTGELQTVSTGRNGSRISPKYDIFAHVSSPYKVLKQLQTQISKRKEKLS